VIFLPGLAKAILAGKKVETRRLVKPGDNLLWMKIAEHPHRGNPAHVHIVLGSDGRIRWTEGKTYAVQPGRGKKAIGYIRVEEIRQERLQQITLRGARREGMSGRKAFTALWNGIHESPHKWASNPQVWVLVFRQVLAKSPGPVSPAERGR